MSCLKQKTIKESKKKAQFSLEYQGASHSKTQGQDEVPIEF